jgi:hypothetical protein
MIQPVDEETILRFASGELDAEEEANLLARCEIFPETWREAVLAVAEHHRLLAALGETAPALGETTGPASTASARHGRWLGRTALAAASLAAGLLLGVVGMHFRTPAAGSPRETLVATHPEPQPAAKAVPVALTAVPEESADNPTIPSLIPAAQVAELQRRGFEVQQEPTLYLITASNGTRWAVPTQRTTLHYVKQ